MVELRKVPISAQKYKEDSLRLARMIIDSGFDPEFTVALYRGGAMSFAYVTDALLRHRTVNMKLSDEELERYHDDALKVRSYSRAGQQKKVVRISGAIEHVVETIRHREYRRGVLGDDVMDTALSVDAVMAIFERGLERGMAVGSEPRNSDSRLYTFEFDSGSTKYLTEVPLRGDIEPLNDCDIRPAMPYSKAYDNKTRRRPWKVVEIYDRFPDGSSVWLNFPHEVSDLGDSELEAFDPNSARILLADGPLDPRYVDMQKVQESLPTMLVL